MGKELEQTWKMREKLGQREAWMKVSKSCEGLNPTGECISYMQQGSNFRHVSSVGPQSFLLLISKVAGARMNQAECQGSWRLSCPKFKGRYCLK